MRYVDSLDSPDALTRELGVEEWQDDDAGCPEHSDGINREHVDGGPGSVGELDPDGEESDGEEVGDKD